MYSGTPLSQGHQRGSLVPRVPSSLFVPRRGKPGDEATNGDSFCPGTRIGIDIIARLVHVY